MKSPKGCALAFFPAMSVVFVFRRASRANCRSSWSSVRAPRISIFAVNVATRAFFSRGTPCPEAGRSRLGLICVPTWALRAHSRARSNSRSAISRLYRLESLRREEGSLPLWPFSKHGGLILEMGPQRKFETKIDRHVFCRIFQKIFRKETRFFRRQARYERAP